MGRFSYWGLSSQSQKFHLHAIRGIYVNCIDIQSPRSLPPMTFIDKDFKSINPINQDDPMVISIVIANFMVSKVLIYHDSSTDILYWKTFQRLEVSPDMIQPHYGSLLGFVGDRVETRGYVDLIITFGLGKLSRSFTIRYLIVDANTFYFALIGRKTLNELEAIVSTLHLKMKFLTLTREIITIEADQKQAR